MPTPFTGARRIRLLTAVAAVAVSVTGCASPGAAPSASPTDDAGAALNTEELRLSLPLDGSDEPLSAAMIESGGLADVVADFRSALADADAGDVADLAEESGQALWTAAVTAAQGSDQERADEDRGLYWARLAMRVDLKKWASDGDRTKHLDAALAALEDASRGYGDAVFASDGARHVMLSGFDPFGDWEKTPGLSNPAASIALHLDGRTIDTPTGPVVFQAVMLPVNWQAFDDEAVERAFAPALAEGDADADLAVTVSQGGYDDFEIEQWAGAWRDGTPDNVGAGEKEGYREEVPFASSFPQPDTEPQFIETTLPVDAMIAAGTTPYGVKLNPITCTATTAERADDGVQCDTVAPAAGAFASSGSGGAYLSNESMYRVNRLRQALGRDDIRGGHLHTPLPKEPTKGTEIPSERRAIVDQATALLLAAATAG